MIIIFVPVLLENAGRIKMFLFSSHSIDEHWELFYSENYKPTENVGISFFFHHHLALFVQCVILRVSGEIV